VRAADPVPDLSAAILAAARPVLRARGRRIEWLRYGLVVVALTQVVLALPELLAHTGGVEPVHIARHLGGWDLAFAIGLVVAALQPWRARGLLPMAAALGGVMVLTAGLDVLGGQAAALAEGSHLLEVTGLVLLWRLARIAPTSADPTAKLTRTIRDRARVLLHRPSHAMVEVRGAAGPTTPRVAPALRDEDEQVAA